MQIRLILIICLIICFVILAFTGCERAKENEKNKTKRRENVENQTNDEILVETEYGDYAMNAEWFNTRQVAVKGENILFRNSLGITKKYQFDDITHVVKYPSRAYDALGVYSGNKELFTIDPAIDCLYFEIQLSQKGVPKEIRRE